jgi:hypothetical protein
MTIFDHRPIDVTVPGRPDDSHAAPEHPRRSHPRRARALHPDDVAVDDGIRMTTPARTLVGLSACVDRDELRATFARAREIGQLVERLGRLADDSMVQICAALQVAVACDP